MNKKIRKLSLLLALLLLFISTIEVYANKGAKVIIINSNNEEDNVGIDEKNDKNTKLQSKKESKIRKTDKDEEEKEEEDDGKIPTIKISKSRILHSVSTHNTNNKENKKQDSISTKNLKKLVKVEKNIGPISPIKIGENGSYISSRFGRRVSPTPGASTFHKGVDIAAPRGTYVRTPFAGTVKMAQQANGGAGNTIKVDHGNGMETIYMHMSKRAVSVGDKVKPGQILGMVGTTGVSTGNHLHFELRRNGIAMDPMSLIR